jgi:small subunit ribosomal protein S9
VSEETEERTDEQPEEHVDEQPEEHVDEQPSGDQAAEGQPDSAQLAEGQEPIDVEQAEPQKDEAPEVEPRKLIELAADARYSATGKRKSAVARVTLRPGNGNFELNGRSLGEYFPRRSLQAIVRQPLEASGYADRINVKARVGGGGISGQADAVRHGIAKALIEADPAMRGELKRRQLLTRDPRVKERYKAGLKKARKRPQFSKR